MPPQFPSIHRGMTANPARAKRYRPGKPIAEEPSSDEDEVEEEEEEETRARAEEEERRKRQQQQARPPPPKATSYPAQAAGRLAQGVQEVKIEDEDEDEDSDEEGFVTEEEEEEQKPAPAAKPAPVPRAPVAAEVKREDESEEEEEEEEEDEDEDEESEEESSEDEGPKRVLLRPTFIKKDKRKDTNGEIVARTSGSAEAEDEAEVQRRKEKADMLLRDQLEKEALARSAAKKAWDAEDEAAEEAALDDRDGLDPEAEYQAWKLRELKRIKRAREAIEAAEREREEIERRRNLTAEEREREDREFLAKQREEREANRGPSKYLQRYFHKGAFFRDELEKEGLDKRDLMGSRYADETNREVLPEYMQLRDMTKLGRKGRTRYKDLRTEDTGLWGQGLDYRPRKPRPDKPIGINDERFMPDYDPRQRSPSRRTRSRSRSRSRSPPRRRYRDDDYDRDDDRRYPRKRSHSPHDDRDKRRRLRSVSPTR